MHQESLKKGPKASFKHKVYIDIISGSSRNRILHEYGTKCENWALS